ncbi:HesA/MoeB/ThiF family protein [Saccharibacter sp. 17.LH.SD]|uniref:HesA/MoeB/ThiF family protein n=1 Tax=Saccharibacter sp. 17.LH.SD TaxID=2689393 RepID=UPI001371B213|nr:HesA/MoeB/ThiF family protein [Saccharibacter sp. 17.LH.SD]MXV44460.1 HesA/MoeB/ThiF family protein [Saccharibacter sp. 17.LH.SD]
MRADRYQTQKLLLEIGESGQQKLAQATVFVVGAGGLGCALLPWLAGAGIGHIHVMDDDVIELKNLHRQPLYHMEDLGQSKADIACQRLRALNPDCQFTSHVMAAQPDTVRALIQKSDVVIDAADNFATTYVLSDACQRVQCVLVSGSSLGWEGYVGAFCGNGPSYRAVFPKIPENSQKNCGQAGIVGPVVAVIGSVMAQFCLSLLLDITPSPVGELRRWDARVMQMRHFSFRDAEEPSHFWPFLAWSELRDDDVVVDVRLLDEKPTLERAKLYQKPLPEFEKSYDDLPQDRRLVICCQTGVRASKAASFLAGKGYTNIALMAVAKQPL